MEEAYFAAGLNVAAAVKALSLHPNSLRYLLRRTTEITGHDPRTLAGLLELIAAARPRCPDGGGPAGLARVITADMGKCEGSECMLREGWGTFGGDCRVAGRELSAGRHV